MPNKKQKNFSGKDSLPSGEYNLINIKKDFPILSRKINGKPLIYLDNAATTQKPASVISSMSDFYSNSNANIHRSIHSLGEEATALYEKSHEAAANFINAGEDEVIFTKNATESINLVMRSWGMKNIKKGDEIVLSEMEHHSNLVPWQQLAKEKKATLKFLELDPKTGSLGRGEASAKITKKTRLVSIIHASNVMGTVNDIEHIGKVARENHAAFMVDASQSIPHFALDVKKIGCDFLAFSSHKMLGPAGIGVLYGKSELLGKMDPFLFGGDMISSVSYKDAEWNELPWKFEAGTPNVAGAVGFSEAISYINKLGYENIQKHESDLAKYAFARLSEIRKLTIYGHDFSKSGQGQKSISVFSFTLGDIHPHDIATILDREGIAIRAGHHCAMPLIRKLGLTATARASFYIYNSKEEIDRLAETLERAKKVFGI